MSLPLHPARWWNSEPGSGAVRCRLCPRHCLIPDGQSGRCGVRVHRGGELFTAAFGYPAALQVDPIEKKPLYHFLPRTRIFSIGTFGCSLGCVFCQNDRLSAGVYGEGENLRRFEPEEIVRLARHYGCESIAFTYNEPTVFAEYALAVAERAHGEGLKTVFVSNGYIDPEAAREIYPHIDAANIDIKGFSEEFYRSMTGGSLRPVLDAVEYYHCTLRRHVELTNLVIPDRNDAPEMIDAYLDWVETRLGFEVPLHFSAYHPAFRYRDSPPTPPALLRKIGAHAEKRGFKFVHLGNI